MEKNVLMNYLNYITDLYEDNDCIKMIIDFKVNMELYESHKKNIINVFNKNIKYHHCNCNSCTKGSLFLNKDTKIQLLYKINDNNKLIIKKIKNFKLIKTTTIY